MSSEHRLPIVFLLFSVFLISGVGSEAEAVTDRRYLGVTISNEKGEGVEGVRVVLTSDEQPSLREEQTSNKKGKATVSVTDATKKHQLRFEAKALQLADTKVTIQVSNEKGEPADEVMIVVTCDELPRFQKKGKPTVSFTDATKAYTKPLLVLDVELIEILD